MKQKEIGYDNDYELAFGDWIMVFIEQAYKTFTAIKDKKRIYTFIEYWNKYYFNQYQKEGEIK